MSAVKIFALGVLVTGTLASSTLAGSIRSSRPSPSQAASRSFAAPTSQVVEQANAPARAIAAENLAGGWTSFGVINLGSATTSGSFVIGQGNTLTLGTNAPAASSSPFNLARPPASPAPAPAPTLPSPAPAQSYQAPAQADAFINFGNGPYLESNTLTTGNAQSFLSSPAFAQFFKNGPTSSDVANFENQVVSTIQKTYSDAGLPIHLTTDPNALAAHTLSIVSGTNNPQVPNAIGITDVGNNGFSFIDKFGSAQSVSQLATAVGHNIAHELMHAFGLANHPETNGPYVDAATTTFSSLADPSTTFSSSASSLLSTLNFQATGQSINAPGAQTIDGAQVLVQGSPVPEPTTVALWTVLAGAVGYGRSRRKSA